MMLDDKELARRADIRNRYEKSVLPQFAESIEKSKQEFINICKTYIKSRDCSKILEYLEKSDFYETPSSTQFHLNCPGGLCRHSINVFKVALDMSEKVLAPRVESKEANCEKVNPESVAVAALFHDLCKIGTYYPEEKFTKEGTKWVKYLGWGIDDQLPMGHAEKSLYRLSRLIALTPEEIMSIRWHMGMFDMGEKGSSLRISYYDAMDMYPLVTILQNADMFSSKCLEETYDLKKYTL